MIYDKKNDEVEQPVPPARFSTAETVHERMEYSADNFKTCVGLILGELLFLLVFSSGKNDFWTLVEHSSKNRYVNISLPYGVSIVLLL